MARIPAEPGRLSGSKTPPAAYAVGSVPSTGGMLPASRPLFDLDEQLSRKMPILSSSSDSFLAISRNAPSIAASWSGVVFIYVDIGISISRLTPNISRDVTANDVLFGISRQLPTVSEAKDSATSNCNGGMSNWISICRTLLDYEDIQAARINRTGGSIRNVRIQIDSALMANRIGSHKSARRWVVVAMSEKLQPGFVVGVITKLRFVAEWLT